VVALQGKPQVRFPAAVAATPPVPTAEFIQVRSPSPTREFLVSDFSVPVTARRAIVSTEKCLACHLGTLYQHGGNRVDSVDLCVTCHNPASSEGNNRFNMGVDEIEAYDSKIAETYDMRTMTHAIHSAGESGRQLVYYRNNGIYFFGSKAALARVTWWPTTGGITCKNAEGATVTYFKVFGSSATGKVPAADVDGKCKADADLVASTDGTWRIHNFIEVHYPRALNDCSACHVDGSAAIPDPTKAVAVTFAPGAAPFNGLLNDVLVGPTTASCMSCHQSGVALDQFFLQKHAYDNSWEPSAFANGRQTLIDAVK